MRKQFVLRFQENVLSRWVIGMVGARVCAGIANCANNEGGGYIRCYGSSLRMAAQLAAFVLTGARFWRLRKCA